MSTMFFWRNKKIMNIFWPQKNFISGPLELTGDSNENMKMIYNRKNISSFFNPSPAEPGYTLPLQTVYIQISWLLKKPTDLNLHCLPLSM